MRAPNHANMTENILLNFYPQITLASIPHAGRIVHTINAHAKQNKKARETQIKHKQNTNKTQKKVQRNFPHMKVGVSTTMTILRTRIQTRILALKIKMSLCYRHSLSFCEREPEFIFTTAR